MRYALIAALLVLSSLAAMADDIVTMPTANQLKKGEIDVAGYYIGTDFPPGAPENVLYGTLYTGITDRFEVDLHYSDVDKNEDATIAVVQYKFLTENMKRPDMVVGIRNLFGTPTADDNPFTPVDERDKSKDQSYYVAAAKTFFFNPKAPGPPLVRAHLGLGTEDWTLFGEKRHDGLFGGLQFLFRPELGAVVQYDAQDLITGITIMPKNTGLTLKGGTYGDHWWVGVAWRTKAF